MSSATLPAPVSTIKNSGHAKQFPGMTSTTDHVEAKHKQHELVCELRGVRVETHLPLRSTCTADCRRNGESCVGAEVRSGPNTTRSFDPTGFSTRNLSIPGCSQTSIHSNLCAMISTMLTTAFKIPSSQSLLMSPSRISKDLALDTAARSEVPLAAGSSAVPDASHHASTCSATMCG